MIAILGYSCGCNCNLRSRVTCLCSSTPACVIVGSTAYVTDGRRTQRRQKPSRATAAKWRRIDITRAQNRAAIFRAWRESFRQPPQPRIEKHKRIHRHSAKG